MHHPPPSVTREQLMNKLRELEFSHRKTREHASLWRRASDGTRVELPNKAKIDGIAARTILRQAGCADDEIATFFRHCTC